MRLLTNDEILDVADEIKYLVYWKTMKNFADKYYPGAIKLKIFEGSIFNDEGYDYRVDNIDAYGSNKRRLDIFEGDTYTEEDSYYNDMRKLPMWNQPLEDGDSFEVEIDLTTIPEIKYNIWIEEK